MAKDIVMSKGDITIKISPDFQEYYEKQGFTVGEKKQKISVEKETQNVIKELKKEEKKLKETINDILSTIHKDD